MLIHPKMPLAAVAVEKASEDATMAVVRIRET